MLLIGDECRRTQRGNNNAYCQDNPISWFDWPRRLALLMHEVSYMASAGLRVLIFAKQRLGTDVDIFVVGAQAPVLETLRTTGFDYGCVLLDSYDAQQIENIGSAR
jgi:anti-anti-sigma factor